MSKIDKAELIELLDEGVSKTDAARWFGVTRQAITSALRPGVKAYQTTQPHVEGQPVNRSTYVNYGCRCAGCRRANAER